MDLLGIATANRGLALAMQGDVATGIPLIRDSVAAVHTSGAGVVRPPLLGMLALADSMEGNWEAAGRRLDEALVEVERTGERVCEVLLRIGMGHVLAARGRPDGAEACFRRALAVARAQAARLMELRAAVALARHVRDHGRPGEALAVLTPAYAGFATVRHLTPDVVAARELLAELGGPRGRPKPKS
jgi:predicted ATPase